MYFIVHAAFVRIKLMMMMKANVRKIQTRDVFGSWKIAEPNLRHFTHCTSCPWIIVMTGAVFVAGRNASKKPAWVTHPASRAS